MIDLSLQETLQKLPLELQVEVRDFAEFLLERKKSHLPRPIKFQWEGALKDMREQFTSAELQHQISAWRGNI
ncbi:MAG: DUF2281 domain-containing protein [Anaerolineales bacterium]